MNNNTDPAIAAARLGDELSSIAGRMSAVSDEFASLAERLASSAVAGFAKAEAPAAAPTKNTEPAKPAEAPAPKPAPAPRPPTPVAAFPPAADTNPQPQPQPQPQRQPQPMLQYMTAAPSGPRPYGPQQPPVWPRFPAPAPARPRKSRGERLAEAAERGLIGRVLAAVGVGITLIGIVLLLILAAQAGLLRPEVRVAGGALFAVALVAIGCRIGRREEKRPGALALVATGVAAALFDVLAATSIYRWLPEIASLVLGGAIGAGGLYVAHRWNSQTLGLMVSIPMLVFAPVVAGGVDSVLICFMLVYAASTLWIQVGRDWTALFVVNTVAATLPLLVIVGVDNDSPAWLLVLTGLVNLALALGSTVVLAPSSTRAVILGLTAVGAALPLPLLCTDLALNRPTSTAVVGLGALIFVVAAFATRGRASIPFVCRAVWLGASAVMTVLAVAVALRGDAVSLGFLGAAVVVIIGSRWAGDLAEIIRVIACVFGGFGLATLLAFGGVQQVLVAASLDAHDQATLLAGAILGLAAATLIAYELGERVPTQAQQIWLIGGFIDLWLITELCVSVGNLTSGGTVGGFRGGHLAATLIWFGAAAVGLMWARTLSGSNRSLTLATGLTVLAAAVAKLFLFDLATLAGVYRVVAFIVAGLVLLSLGVAYAQSLTSDSKEAQPTGPAVPS